MTLGGTWGFMLDMIFGTDEGFREYLWSAPRGMAYAMGCLYSQRFGRYTVTILFDMFFTVILFKHLYAKLVVAAGFSVRGREWIANGFVSTLISTLTFEVYANMTRFQWAYPSGTESLQEPWLSGPQMVLATVIMNMVYLTVETRTRMGEMGINDPNVKLAVTGCNFITLLLLTQRGYIDPSDWSKQATPASSNATTAVALNATVGSAYMNVHLPLADVCMTQAKASTGVGIFFAIVIFCLGFVIFVTSAQSLSGLRDACCCCCGSCGSAKPPPSARPALQGRKNSLPVSAEGEPIAPPPRSSQSERIKAQILLFLLFLVIVVLVVAVFTIVPFYSADTATHGPRNDAAWRKACDDNDVVALRAMGLS